MNSHIWPQLDFFCCCCKCNDNANFMNEIKTVPTWKLYQERSRCWLYLLTIYIWELCILNLITDEQLIIKWRKKYKKRHLVIWSVFWLNLLDQFWIKYVCVYQVCGQNTDQFIILCARKIKNWELKFQTDFPSHSI